MAKMSIRVHNRKVRASYVVSSLDENREAVVRGLLAHNAYLPVGLRISEANVRVFLEWLANTLRHKTEAMLTAETEYVNEQADDPVVRERRDAAMPPLISCMSRTRNRVEAVVGEAGLSTYGLLEPVPRQPGELVAYATTVIDLLGNHPQTKNDGLGGTFDTAALAGAIRDALTPLHDALRDLVTEQHQLQAAMLRRDTELSEWNDVYVNGASTFASLSRMAGEAEVGRRVRPVSRRRRRGQGVPVDAVPTPGLPANDEDTVEAEAVTPVAAVSRKR